MSITLTDWEVQSILSGTAELADIIETRRLQQEIIEEVIQKIERISEGKETAIDRARAHKLDEFLEAEARIIRARREEEDKKLRAFAEPIVRSIPGFDPNNQMHIAMFDVALQAQKADAPSTYLRDYEHVVRDLTKN